MRWVASLKGAFSSRGRHEPRPSIGGGDVEGAYRRGMHLVREGRDRQAFRFLRYAAVAGHADAAYQVGMLYTRYQMGSPVTGPLREQKRVTGARWAAELARHQRKPATKVAFYLCCAGECAQAEGVLRQAAGNGDADAAYELGEILETGRQGTACKGRPVVLAEAERYYLIAGELGHPVAHERLGLMLAGTGRPAEAEPHLLDAAGKGSWVACLRLGEAAAHAGRDQEAERYLRMAAKGGIRREGVLALADFLNSKGRRQEALSLLRREEELTLVGFLGSKDRINEVLPRLSTRAKRAAPSELRAIATALRGVGLDTEARKYEIRAKTEEGLDAIDKCLE